jgi:hypothetical protein
VRDHDELAVVAVLAQQRDQAIDVDVVERGLGLVEDVERARLREEDAEEEGQRDERALSAGEQCEYSA